MSNKISGFLDHREIEALAKEWVIDDQTSGIFKVSRLAFTDEAIFELEKRVIFSHCWLYLGHVSEVNSPTSFVTRRVAGQELIFNRDRGGVIHAFFNTCSHRGAQLCKERSGKRGSFACPYHGWLYDDRGSLINIPGKQAYSTCFIEDKTLGLTEVPRIAEYCGFVFVCFDPEASSLEDYLADAREILELVADQGENGMEICGGVQEYSTPANWKLMLENSADGYHAGPTHASYFDYVVARDGAFVKTESQKNLNELVGVSSLGVGMRSLGNGHSVIETVGPWGRPCARWVPGWGESVREEVAEIGRRIVARVGEERGRRITQVDRNTLIFPNFVVNDLMAITARTFYPVRPDYMEITAWALAPVGESEKARARRLQSFVEFFGPAGFASPDDVEMLELCQRGYSNSDFLPWNDISKGMSHPIQNVDDEEQMREFWRRWVKMMVGAGEGGSLK